jgi:hypothetical protein
MENLLDEGTPRPSGIPEVVSLGAHVWRTTLRYCVENAEEFLDLL